MSTLRYLMLNISFYNILNYISIIVNFIDFINLTHIATLLHCSIIGRNVGIWISCCRKLLKENPSTYIIIFIIAVLFNIHITTFEISGLLRLPYLSARLVL